MQALEVQPTAREVVHHVLVFALPKGARIGGEAMGFLAAYVPGNNTLVYPDGYAKKLPKGTTLRFQIHYTPNGKATTDQTRLGVIFAKEPPKHEVQVVGIANVRFQIPPGADNHKIAAQLPVPFDARVLAVFPHAHLRGKAMQYELKTPDGKTDKLLEVPHYDFNWQLQYRFTEPVLAPRGSTLIYTAWYDNSDKNPANPDPEHHRALGPTDLRGDAPRLSGVCGRRGKRETGRSPARLARSAARDGCQAPQGGHRHSRAVQACLHEVRQE